MTPNPQPSLYVRLQDSAKNCRDDPYAVHDQLSDIADLLEEAAKALAQAGADLMRLDRTNATLGDALLMLKDAAEKMPTRTPAPGGASTVHPFQIEAAHVWQLDLALIRAREALGCTTIYRRAVGMKGGAAVYEFARVRPGDHVLAHLGGFEPCPPDCPPGTVVAEFRP